MEVSRRVNGDAARSLAPPRAANRSTGVFSRLTLSRAEEDTNADGRTDRWDRFEGAVLREVAFDMSRSGGRANRRLLYDEKGRFTAVEDDADGDGTFVRMTGKAAADATAGVKR